MADEDRHQLPVIVVGEYTFGLKRSRGQQLLTSLISESDVLEIDLGTANYYAEIRSDLQQRGEPIPENDLWIAALCLQHRRPLASRDQHFDRISRLERADW
ncbi:MAG TPA: PIN domain-containing protein [Chthoniobacterales bacterium]|nr:PIN domain-containing protein [Chthoniobacterales bacterium]